MTEQESHPIRNGIIATIIGGIVLSFWAPFRDVVESLFLWLWGLVVTAWYYLWEKHEIYGWLLVLFVVLSIPTVLGIVSRFKKTEEPTYLDLYKEDYLFGAVWHWSYGNGGAIGNLWCLCPQCKSELVYSEYVPNPYRFEERGGFNS